MEKSKKKDREASNESLREGPKGEEAEFTAEEVERLSALQLCDLVIARLHQQGAHHWDLELLRNRVEEMEEIQDLTNMIRTKV